MTTFKTKMILFLLRNRHLLQGKKRKGTFDFNTSIEKFREQCEEGASRFTKIPQGVEVKPQLIEGIKAEWLIPAGAKPGKLILYTHGGGYVSGSCNDHRGFVSQFAKNTSITNLVFEYRLAPEHPFPAALDDTLKIYQWLLANGYKPSDIIIAGESAGGGLCLASLIAIRDKELPLPIAAVAISPWTDLSCSSDSYKTKNKKSLAPLNSWNVFSSYYVGNNEVHHPWISPMFGDLKGLPPIFINSGVDDELYEDGEKFYLKAKDAGVDIKFRAGKDMIHCYPLLSPMFKEATEAMDEIVDFVKQYS